jgi:hypothetical protein
MLHLAARNPSMGKDCLSNLQKFACALAGASYTLGEGTVNFLAHLYLCAHITTEGVEEARNVLKNNEPNVEV